MGPAMISITVELPAGPDEVFTAITDANVILKWSGEKGKVDLKIGGKVEMFGGWVKGKVVDYYPGRSLTYTWCPNDWPKEMRNSVVQFKLGPTRLGTKVTLRHSNFPSEQEKGNHKSGWKEYFFDPLRKYLASLTPAQP